MQGAEKELLATHVAAGDVRIVYWPMLDLGPNSLNTTAAAFCAGEQDPAAFWRAHDALYGDQRSVYLAGRDYYLDVAASQGLDTAAFAACYDSEETRAFVRVLDDGRRENQVGVRPTFDIVGPTGAAERIYGSQPFASFDAIIQAQLP